MSRHRKFDTETERDAVLAHYCDVNPEYMQREWRLSRTTASNLVRNRQGEISDPLVDFYRDGCKQMNATHLYLAFSGMVERLPKAELVDKERDERVYGGVDSTVINPRILDVIKKTGLKDILIPEKQAAEEKLLYSVFGKLYKTLDAFDVIMPMVYETLMEEYLNPPMGDPAGRYCLNRTFNRVLSDIRNQLRTGLMLTRDPEVQTFVSQRKAKKDADIKEKVKSVLDTLSFREQEVLKLRYGLGDEHMNTLEEAGRILNATRERVRQIEGSGTSYF